MINEKKGGLRLCSAAAAIAISLVYGSAAYAQEAAADSGEIIVTANKREENLNKVGLTITAISAETLAERKITSLEDIATAVPGLSYAPSTTNTPIFTLRGVGFNESSLGVYPAVSVYLDQAPLPFPVMASHTAFDLERIEALKGPQGTLFGQNSTGGAINYIAAKPSKTFVAGGDIGYGRFNQIDGNVYISGPISDNLAFRIAATGLNSDDWQYSYTRHDTNGNPDTNGHQSYVAGRLLLDWEATDTIKLSLNLNGWLDKSQPQAQQLIAVRPQIPAFTNPFEQNYPFAPNNPRAADWTNGNTPSGRPFFLDSFRMFSDRKFYQASLRVDADLTDGITLTSLTTYNDYKQRQVSDGDGMALIAFDLDKNDGYIHSFNQELRLANAPSSSLRWVLGGNFEKSITYEDQNLRYGDNSNYNPNQLFINSSGVTNKQNITNYAIFGNIEYSISSQLTLRGAARYTSSKNHANVCGYNSGDGHIGDFFNILGTLLGTVPFTPVGLGGCQVLNENNVPGFPFIRTQKENNVSWKVGADYQINSDTLLYANISRGYKAGSFPTIAAATYTGLAPVTQESVTAYEAGVKAKFADRRISVNAAGFYYDYKDKQVRGKLLDPVFGILDALVNVPKSRIYGFEADLTLRPVDGLTISAAGTYLDSKVTRFTGVNILGLPDNFSGDPLPFTPKWSGSVNVDYRMHLSGGGTPFVGVSLNSRSSSDAAFGAHRIVYPVSPTTVVKPGVTYVNAIDGYSTIDARLGYEAPDAKWKVILWGKNLTNKYYWTAVVPASDSTSRIAGRPATYGVTFSFKMN